MSNVEFREFPKIARLNRECLITEKIDGTNASILITEDGQFLTGSRTRWITPQDDNYGFSKWAHDHRDELMQLGPGHHFGEWWGCLSAETSISLSDGSTAKIGKIVNQKLPVEVLSYNFDKQAIEPKMVIGWKKGPVTDDWLSINVKRKRRGGREIGLHLTPNHVLYRKNTSGEAEEVNACDIRTGDELFINSEGLSHLQEQVVRGSALGDGSISDDGIFCCGHSNKQYAESKNRILKNLISSNSEAISGRGSLMHRLTLKAMPATMEMRELLYPSGAKILPVSYVRRLHSCGLAFWYMDDGSLQETDGKSPVCSIYTNGFSIQDVSAISSYFNEAGLWNYLVFKDGMPILKFTPPGTLALHAMISPFVTPEMRYKIIPQFRNVECLWTRADVIGDETKSLGTSVVESITDTYAKGNRSKHRFDIEVEGNNNFFANNILVHNSGCQRGYGLQKGEKRWSLFNVARWCLAGEAPQRIPCADPRVEKFQDTLPACCHLVPLFWRGNFCTVMVAASLETLRIQGSRAAPGFMKPEGIVCFHVAANQGFKVTLEKDGEPKGKLR